MAIASYMIIVCNPCFSVFTGRSSTLAAVLSVSRKPNRWLGLILPLISFYFPPGLAELPPTRPCAPQLPIAWENRPPYP